MSAQKAEMTRSQVLMEDYATNVIPEVDLKGLLSVTVVWGAAVISAINFGTGSLIAQGLPLWATVGAILIGGLLIQWPVQFLVGAIGSKLHAGTGFFSRWVGFGFYGSLVPSAIIGFAAWGWLCFHIAIFGSALQQIIPVPMWVCVLIAGACVTAITIYGYTGLEKVANWALPIFLLLMIYAVIKAIAGYGGLSGLAAKTPPKPMTFNEGVTIATGLFIGGSVMMSDITRYAKTFKITFTATLIGSLLGLIFQPFAGAVLGIASGEWDPVVVLTKSTGIVAALVICLITITTANYCVYLASLCIANINSVVRHLPQESSGRKWWSIIIGIVATIIAAMNLLQYVGSWCNILAIMLPPLGGTFIAHYWLVSGRKSDLSKPPEAFNWAGVISLAAGVLMATLAHNKIIFGMAPIWGILTTIILYWILMEIRIKNGFRGPEIAGRSLS